MKQRYKKLSNYAKEHSVTYYRTAWNRCLAGKIKGAYKDKTGHIVIPVFPENKHINKVAIYARVSNNDRKDELDTQIKRLRDYCASKGYEIVKEVKEIASGMNDGRKKLSNLLLENDWDAIVVENKDRLTRFGYNYIDILLNKSGKKIVVINEAEDEYKD